MQQKAKKTISHVTPVRPLTDEEKKERVIRFLAQKREQYAISILQGIVANPAVVGRKSIVSKDGSFTETAEIDNGLVNKAVEMADELLEKLYPLTDGDKGGEVRETPEG